MWPSDHSDSGDKQCRGQDGKKKESFCPLHHFLSHLLVGYGFLHRRSTSPRSGHRTTRSECGNEHLNTSLGTHTAKCQTAQEEDSAADGDVPLLGVATNPALEAGVVARRHTSGRVETFALESGVRLNVVPKVEHGRECVGEVEDEERADDGDETVQVGDGGSDDEGEKPVEGAECVPCLRKGQFMKLDKEEEAGWRLTHPATLLGGDDGEVEDFLEDLDVDSLHADVEVKHCGFWSQFLVYHLIPKRVGMSYSKR